jgi:hypothetical protein
MSVTVARRVCERDSANLSPIMTLEGGNGPAEYQNCNNCNTTIWRSTTMHFGRRVDLIDARRSCKFQPIPARNEAGVAPEHRPYQSSVSPQ